jgi:DNA-directed RNA polymerase subunit alpha
VEKIPEFTASYKKMGRENDRLRVENDILKKNLSETQKISILEKMSQNEFLQTRLVDLDLSVRVLNCCCAAGIDTIAELVLISKDELMRFHNFGKKSLAEIKKLLAENGLSMKDCKDNENDIL